MKIACFVSSVGDTDLIKAVIDELSKQHFKGSITVIPLTATAVSRTEDLIANDIVSRVSINSIVKQPDILSKNQISPEELEQVSSFIKENNIERIFVGVPSIDNEIPFQIASHLPVPCTIGYEFMFKPTRHILWSYVGKLASKGNCDFAVPLQSAQEDFLKINSGARTFPIGHISIDRSQSVNTSNIESTRASLSINKQDELVFISGTTQPTEVDNLFLDALLSEIASGKYPHLQLRMGLHPGVKDPDSYLETLLKTCEKYPKLKEQFKIILTAQFEARLRQSHPSDSFILRREVSGEKAAQAADRVAQAVPGALLNESALNGKPSYFHDKSAVPYLPKKWFSEDIHTFFTAKPGPAHSRDELNLQDSTPNLLAKLLTK